MGAKFKVTEKSYGLAKKLIEAGNLTYKEITEITGIGRASLTFVKQTETFEKYKEFVTDRSLKNRKVEEPQNENLPLEDLKMPGGTLSGAYMMNRIMKLLEEQNETLKLLSNKLAFIVEQLS